jgi:hexokinase
MSHQLEKSVLVIDVGGTSVKILATGNQKVGRFDPDQSSPPGAWCQE